ncbi:aminopeptidase [Desulforamulus putei]|uniref:Leucyl aminopeptidase (Aminopeptidase T) n=1 Tax=Desulforamulus putei DSM 12395 TaxID=1121429 RepID=A0A1M4U2T7_9FIRM|nr:aminopeptidase [Desulforamulus putei]SHE50936.1 Leucyl aminopeptidase (aminopeptidase T) [Desulforamulus putei DSM 12395]
MSSLEFGARVALEVCLGVKKGEKVLVVADEGTRTVGRSLWEQAISLGAEAMLLEMLPRSVNGEEPPAAVAEAMKQVDVVVAATTKSLSHTRARREANRCGARVASLPGITGEMLSRTMTADYQKISDLSARIADLLSRGNEARIVTPAGTDLTMSLQGRAAHPDTGMLQGKGMFGNLPAGEAYIAPVEGTANGTLVIDGAMAGVGMLKGEIIRITVQDGYTVGIQGGQGAKVLEDLLKPLGKEAGNIAELGVGTNDKAIITGNVLEDEKVLGTVHVALGNSISFGGTVDVPIHLDGILLKPTLIVDGQEILKEGKMLIS